MSTNTTDLTPSVDTFVADYRAADRAGKAAIRAAVDSGILSALTSTPMDTDLAAHLGAVKVALKESGAAAEKSAPDYRTAIADLRATLLAAVARIDDGLITMPEGVEVPDLSDMDWDAGTVDEKAAVRFATVTGRKSGRGSVGDYVDSVLGDEPMTIAELRAAWSASDDYPKAPPSAGAIGAYLDRVADGRTEADIEVVTVRGVKGAARA